MSTPLLQRPVRTNLGWQLLASSRNLAGDRNGALEAWNTVGRPTIDLLRIDGTSHIRFDVLSAAVAAPAGGALTSLRLDLAQRRSVAAVGIGAWVTPNVEQQVGARLERWSGRGELFAISVGDAVHVAHDRLTLLSDAEHAVALTGATRSYDRVRSRLVLSLAPDAWANTWSLRLGGEWASRSAPRALWSQAGGALSRDIPLRAHPLVVDESLPERQRGRGSLVGGMAGDRPLAAVGQMRIGVGIFVDAAQLMLREGASPADRLYVDAGAGLRLGLAGADRGLVRLDLARGLAADRRWAVTVGLDQARFPRLGRSR